MLTIAGFDPSSGAGVTADLAVFSALGAFGTSCVTALTVQSTRGVCRTEPVDARIVRETLACLSEDLPPSGIKIGMLASAENVRAVAAFLIELRTSRPLPVVLDPVLRSTSGAALLESGGIALLGELLLPVVTWVTPNELELGLLLEQTVSTPADMERGALALQARYPELGVVVTGGDRERPDDLVLEPGGRMTWLRGEHIESRSTHGTGCAFSSVMTYELSRGGSGPAAASLAKEFVSQAIRTAVPLGAGKGPMNLLWPLRHG